jgi:hypothetical protein
LVRTWDAENLVKSVAEVGYVRRSEISCGNPARQSPSIPPRRVDTTYRAVSGPCRHYCICKVAVRGISHEYRLVKGADHVGASLVPRSLDAFAFIGRQLNPPKWIDDTALRFRATSDENKKARGYPVTPFDPNRIHAE